MAALFTTVGCFLLFGSWFIDRSRELFRSQVREWTPQSHQSKNNMPTMGGLFIIAVVVFNTILWANLAKPYVWIFMFCLLAFGCIGCIDDINKISKKRGVSAATKFFAQVGIAGCVALLLLMNDIDTTICVPFFKNLHPDLGWFFVPWVMFIVVGCSNAVNLTDGLDGLAIGSLLPNFGTFAIIAYLAGHIGIAHYLNIPYADTSELVVIGATLVGASLGFLWYNAHPAQIFMGDVGSLALGSALALFAIMTKQELLLPLAGGLFVIETLSVIIQIASYRFLGRRIFQMAPIHHHFELKGWPESKITVRFGIISVLLCLFALMTLKIR